MDLLKLETRVSWVSEKCTIRVTCPTLSIPRKCRKCLSEALSSAIPQRASGSSGAVRPSRSSASASSARRSRAGADCASADCQRLSAASSSMIALPSSCWSRSGSREAASNASSNVLFMSSCLTEDDTRTKIESSLRLFHSCETMSASTIFHSEPTCDQRARTVNDCGPTYFTS